ncbi:MAG: competence/damage-inducible protein A [Sandaracinaceae bacterium]|jgi:molybdenum cofactor synthesis domain-containing protein|nr:competence/damage-inducible protein A [Sandaracinaceae bacterium]
MARTAAILIIGNEILTGKVKDQNVALLAAEFFALGVSLRRVVVCPDEVEVIARDVNELRLTHDFVITTGGVGPTHDDVTIQGVAAAFGRNITRSAEMEERLRAHYKERITEGHLRMADMPEGADLVRNAEVPWPTVAVENVFIFPGVPELLKLKFPVLRDRLRDGAPFATRAVYTLCDEGEIAELLISLVKAHPEVAIGSYIKWRGTDYTTKLTFDGKDSGAVDRAADALIAAIPQEKLVTLKAGSA